MAQRGACGGAPLDRRRGVKYYYSDEETKGRSQGDSDKKDQNMMCIGNTQYINTQHRNRCACERRRVLIASEQAMSKNNGGWMDMYSQGYNA